MRTALAAIVAGTLLSACSAPPPDLEAARRAVAAADSAWAAAAAAHDLEGSVAGMAEDGVMYPPDLPPVVGRAAIREYMAAAFQIPGFRVEWDPGEIHVASGGDLAYATARSRYTLPDSNGTLHIIHAKGVSVWRREPDGRWRCVVDIWNGAPPADSASPGT